MNFVFFFSGVQISWLKNATRLLSTIETTQRIPMNLVTRPMYRTPRPHNYADTNELPDDRNSVVIEADTESEIITTTTTPGN